MKSSKIKSASKGLALLIAIIAGIMTYSPAQAVEDLKRFPQNASAYMPTDAEKPIAAFDNQRAYADEFRVHYFSPWQNSDISYLDFTWEKLGGFQSRFLKKNFYGKDGKLFPSDQLANIASNAYLGLNLQLKPAVVVKDTDVRVLPSAVPLYPSRESALGERGFLAADSLQNSTVKPGEPAAVLSQSTDEKWVLIATGSVLGWVRHDTVAYVTPEFMDSYTESPLVVFIKDNVRIRDERGTLLATAKMGTILPSDGGFLLLPTRGKQGMAVIKKYKPVKETTAPFPVNFTPSNAARAIEQLLGERYSWGGSNGLRDCSAMTKDYFALFGIWLPRNSGDQAKTGASISVSELQTGQKLQTIITRGVPFATLLHMKGHIMLYLGVYDGEPVVLHNLWGIHTTAKGGKSARVIVGKTAVTSLYLGKEIENRKKSSYLINNISSLVFPMANMW